MDGRMAPGTPPIAFRMAAHPLRWQLMRALAESDLRVAELAERVGERQNLVSYHLRLLREAGLVRSRRSSFDARDAYYQLDLDAAAAAIASGAAALHPALGSAGVEAAQAGRERPRVLFVCTGNSARSPMAEALVQFRTGGAVEAASAGTSPGETYHVEAGQALRARFGIDLPARRPRAIGELDTSGFATVVTLCDRAREACPPLPHRPRGVHWSIPDPAAAGEPAAFDRTALELDRRIRWLLPLLRIEAP